jgi:hypothetical protein
VNTATTGLLVVLVVFVVLYVMRRKSRLGREAGGEN